MDKDLSQMTVDELAAESQRLADKVADLAKGTTPQTATRYRLNVWATVPNDDEGQPAYTAREMEKHIFQVLKRADADCDCETMDSEVVPEAVR